MTPSVGSYGEVARFGGFDTGATYLMTGSRATSGLPEKEGEAAKFVYPLSMAVDKEDPKAPDDYAIYVLENVNPQALDPVWTEQHPTSLELEYRIQKVSDTGIVLASTKFTLKSSTQEPGLHAVSLAVDGPADRVYVLIMDVPTTSENSGHHSAVDAIDAWTTGRNGNALEPAVEKTTGIDDNLKADSRTGGGELDGPTKLQSGAFANYIDGASLVVYGSGPTADLALGGNQYTSASATKPIVELIKTSGSEAGKVEATSWGGGPEIADTEDAEAKNTHLEQTSSFLYSLSANPNGSLNASLGKKTISGAADLEPNMATIGASALAPTTALLPGAIVSENFEETGGAPNTGSLENRDAAATTAFSQDIHEDGTHAFMPSGATEKAGALAPSVVQLAGGAAFPSELYAGVVTNTETEKIDKQNPTPSAAAPATPPSWKYAEAKVESGTRLIAKPASLAIRIFNSASESLGMIGNVTSGGPCNLQSSPNPSAFSDSVTGTPSFVALAAGREGVVFALVQPDLLASSSSEEGINPVSSVGSSMGDQVVEFAPGADSPGAGANASKWQECPQPEGSFSITNETEHTPAISGTGEVAVPAGTTVKFDAEEVKSTTTGEYESGVNLKGGSPWAYDWDLEGGVDKTGASSPLFEYPWTVRNTFTAESEKNKSWLWPLPTAEDKFETPGTYTETLKLVNDFGTLTAQRTLRVVEAGAIAGAISVPSGVTAEQAVLLKASATLPAGDKVKNYHWEFGDQSPSENTGEAAEAQHTYAQAGVYTVKLTITDALKHEAQAEETVVVVEKEKSQLPKGEPKNETPPTKTETSQTKTETPAGKTTTATTKSTKPLTTAQKLANALKACKKDKSKKQRASCEKQAEKKYATKPKTKKSTKKK